MKVDRRRDRHAPISQFKWIASQYEKVIARDQKGRYMSRDVPFKCIYVALAKYSAGEPVSRVREWLDNAVSYQLKIYEQWDWHFETEDSPGVVADVMAAARLTKRAPELAQAHDRLTSDTPESPGVHALLAVIKWGLVGGPKPRIEPRAVADLGRLSRKEPGLKIVYDLFEEIGGKDRSAFARQLEVYLTAIWRPVAKHYLEYLTRPKPLNLYAGQWSVLSAGVCHVNGEVPQLSSDVQKYVPVELVEELLD